MSFVDTLRQWDEAVTCADRQDWSEALSIFLSIEQPNSKICFDIGCLHLLNQELDAAEKAFDCSIRKDEHLAVAFFQRGVTFYKKERYEESSADFQGAFKALRNNQLIDYKALGLRYILYACEFQIPKKETTKMSTEPVATQTQSPSWADRTAVGGEADNPSIHKREGLLELEQKPKFVPRKPLSRKAAKRPMVTLEELQRPTAQVLHNIALAEAQLGNWEKAQENLAKALDYKTEAKLSIIDKALQATLKQKLFKLVEFPSKTLFKPNKHYVAELEKKDYLGKAKVVASVVPQDEFSGFAPLQPQVEDGPAAPKEPEVLRALEGEAHTVLFEFVPETSNELAVVPGNIVFVLQKGADNWAYVVFNERKGLVPYNYLERLEISLGSKPAKGVARLHSRDPPSRPMRIQGLTPSSSSRNTQQQITHPTDSCFVKIHFTFNFAISVPCGSPYVLLIEKISKKLNLPSTMISLSSDSRGKHLLDNMQMTDVWSRAQDGLITLWCTTKEQSDRKSEKEIYFVALHSYQSSKPEDLSFQEGDKIRLLSRVNQDWLEGQCNGNTGIFPASFAEEVPTNEQ